MRRFTAAFMALVLIFALAGCTAQATTYLYEGKDGDWSIKLPKEFVKDKEEANEQLKSYTVNFKTESESFMAINELIDEKLEITEEKLKEELAEDHYLHVEKYESVDIEGIGKAYGALVTDEATGMSMLYYRLKHKNKAVSFIIYRKGKFSAEQENKAKEMLKTFKGK